MSEIYLKQEIFLRYLRSINQCDTYDFELLILNKTNLRREKSIIGKK